MATHLDGVAALTAQLNQMGLAVAGRELRGTARLSMRIAYNRALATMPIGTVPHRTYKGRLVAPGFARRNFRLITRVDKKTGHVQAIIGPRREAYYITQFVELGTSKKPARPFIRSAMSSSKDAMLKEIATQLRKRLQRIARKKARR